MLPVGARDVNSIERKIQRILNSKSEETLEEAVVSLAQESPNEIKRVLRHYLSEVVDKFLDLDINYMAKVVLFEGWVAPLIEPKILIAELISRENQSESLNVVRSLLLFHLLAREDYFNELKEIIHNEIKSIRNNGLK